jgi:hypothetical protein
LLLVPIGLATIAFGAMLGAAGGLAKPWLLVLPVAGIAWWTLGFPPGWGWLVLPVIPSMPVSDGMLVTLATVVVGAHAGLTWRPQQRVAVRT